MRIKPRTLCSPWPNFLRTRVGKICGELIESGLDEAIALTNTVAYASVAAQAVADIADPALFDGCPISIGANCYLEAPYGCCKLLAYRLLMAPFTDFLGQWSKVHTDAKTRPAFFTGDVLREALVLHMRKWPVTGLFTENVRNVRLLIQTASPTFAKLLDGDTIKGARAGAGRVELSRPRLTALVSEPSGIDGFGADLVRTTTLDASPANRMLFGRTPINAIGSNFKKVGLSPHTEIAYHEAVHRLLIRSIDQVTSERLRPVWRLSPDARLEFSHICSSANSMAANPICAPVLAAYLSHHPGRVLRFAGVLHAVENDASGAVQPVSILAAHEVGKWSIDHFKCLMQQLKA